MFFKKIQNLPESKRKVILWAIVIVFGLGLLIAWTNYAKHQLKQFQKEEFFKKIPSFEPQDFPKIEPPKVEIPEFSEEKLEQLEKEMQENEEQK